MKQKLLGALKVAGIGSLGLVVLVGGYLILRPKPPKPPETIGSVAELETYLNDLTAFGVPPGLSLVVVKDGEMVYSQGFGLADGPNNIPATPDTIYHWWSMTKIPTAVAIMQLHERGLLDIDDPVSDYLDFFDVQYPSADSQTVTIRHLLNHSSGIPNTGLEVVNWIHLEGQPAVNQTALIEEKFPDYATLAFEPGSQAVYTNVGYMVLGAVIEAVSGQTYEDYVRENILQPLEMAQSDFVYTEQMIDDAAVGSHPNLDIQGVLAPFVIDDFDLYVREKVDGRVWFNRLYNDQTPPSGLIGPAPDVARFMLAYLNQGELSGQRILSLETVSMMTYEGHVPVKNRIQTAVTGIALQGLGWGVSLNGEQLDYIEHSGGGPGFGTAMRLYPEQSLGIIVMANDTTYDRNAILDLAASLEW